MKLLTTLPIFCHITIQRENIKNNQNSTPKCQVQAINGAISPRGVLFLEEWPFLWRNFTFKCYPPHTLLISNFCSNWLWHETHVNSRLSTAAPSFLSQTNTNYYVIRQYGSSIVAIAHGQCRDHSVFNQIMIWNWQTTLVQCLTITVREGVPLRT